VTADDARLRMPPPVAAPVPAGAGDADYQAVGLPATYGEVPPMVELWLSTGDRVGLPYAWLSEARFDPSAGVTLAFTTGVAVTVRGRNLGPVYAALVAHRAVYVREADPPTAELLGVGVPVVEAIRVDHSPR